MDIQQERRGRLRAYIAKNFPREGNPQGNVSAFANAIGIQQSQVADMLDRRKSFGEKIARRLEDAAAKKLLPAMKLDGDTPAGVGPPQIVGGHQDRVAESTRLYGHDVTEEAVMFAKEWGRSSLPCCVPRFRPWCT